MILVVFCYIKIHGTFTFVSISVFHDFFHQADLLDDMSRSMRLDAGRKYIEGFHCFVVTVQVILYHFHRFQLFKTCFFCNLVFTFIGIMFQMTYIGDISHIAHFVSQMGEITEQDIEGDGRTGMSQMGIAVYRRATHIHAYMRRVKRNKKFLSAT